MRKIFLILVALSTSIVFSQNLITDYNCTGPDTLNIPSLIDNPSFEDNTTIPTTFTYGSWFNPTTQEFSGSPQGLGCCDYWGQMSNETSDYLWDDGSGPGYNPSGLSFPDGTGAVGAYSCYYDNGALYNEYIGQCLPSGSPLLAGTTYQLQFDMAFYLALGDGTPGCSGLPNLSPIEWTIYGTDDCVNIPMTVGSQATDPISWNDCPTGDVDGNWVVLGTVTIDPDDINLQFGVYNIEFTPTMNIEAWIFGGPCSPPSDYEFYIDCNNTPGDNTDDGAPYFIYDNLIMNETSFFPADLVIEIAAPGGIGVPDTCHNNTDLVAHVDADGTYQWFFEGVIMEGETDSIHIATNDGLYQCMFTSNTTPEWCLIKTATVNYCGCDNEDIIENGSIDGLNGGTGTVGQVGSGWFIPTISGVTYNSPDVNDIYGSAYTTTGFDFVGTPTASPDGGTWQNMYGPEVVGTTFNNLTVGETYMLTFWYALTEINGIPGPTGVDIYIDGVLIETTPSTSVNWDWVSYTFTFTATSTSHIIWFGQSLSSYVAIDGLCIDIGSVQATGDEICENETADVSVVAAFGDGNYTYNWSDGTPNNTDAITVTPTVTTWYYVTVTDGLGQTMTDSAEVIVNPLPIVDLGNDITICAGDNTDIDAGTFSTYLWSTTETTQIINIDAAGTYEVTVTDNNGCENTDAMDLIIAQLPTPNISGSDFCEGYSTTLDAGSGYQTYSWNPTTANTQIINITGGGTYEVTVSDANGCTGIDNISITMNSTPAIDAGVDVHICNGETVILTATSSVSTFNWDNGLGTGNTQTVTPTTTTTYTVSVVDANTCTNSDQVIVNVHSVPTTSISPTNISCNGLNDGSIDLTVNNGTPPYSYNWSDGHNTEDISNLGVDTYSVTVDDDYNCSSTNSASITEPEGMNITNSYLNANCHGDNNLLIDISIEGGMIPYSYEWNNGVLTEDITGITAGIYVVTVTDANNCSSIESFNLNEPSQLVVSLPSDYIHCNHNTNLLVDVEGGTSPYIYQWNTGSVSQGVQYQTTNTATYIVTVTDNNGCNSIDEITISIISVELNAYINNDTVCPGDPVQVTTNINGGLPPYTIYNSGQIISTPVIIYPNGQESYNLEVVDLCGNTDVAIFDVNVYPTPPLNFTADILQGCVPLTVNFNDVNNCNECIYTWNFDDIHHNNLSLSHNPAHTFQEVGWYDVTINSTDKNGCKNQLTVANMIEVYPKPDAMFYVYPEVVSIFNPTIEFTNYSTNNYNNYWSFGDGDSSLQVNPFHEYESVKDYNIKLVVQSDKGCLDTVSHRIKVKDEFAIYVPTAFSPDGDGINDKFRALGHGIDLDNYFIAVYNRWGEIIWESNDIMKEWNGKAKKGSEMVQNGTYKWIVICNDFNGVEHTKSGNVTVIR